MKNKIRDLKKYERMFRRVNRLYRRGRNIKAGQLAFNADQLLIKIYATNYESKNKK